MKASQAISAASMLKQLSRVMRDIKHLKEAQYETEHAHSQIIIGGVDAGRVIATSTWNAGRDLLLEERFKIRDELKRHLAELGVGTSDEDMAEIGGF